MHGGAMGTSVLVWVVVAWLAVQLPLAHFVGRMMDAGQSGSGQN